jgi:hypothetical protein
MKTTIAILAIAFLAVTPAAAKSAASSHAPGHHAKGVHGPGASYYAPGHLKTHKGLKSARTVAPGSYERR